MSKTMKMKEGQSGTVTIKATYENKPVPHKVSINQIKSILNGLIKLKSIERNPDGETNTVSFKTLKKGSGTCTMVFNYGEDATGVEHIDQATELIQFEISPANLVFDNLSPYSLTWMDDKEYAISLKYKNGTELIPTDDPDLKITDSEDFLNITSRSADGFKCKLNIANKPTETGIDVQTNIDVQYFSSMGSIPLMITIPSKVEYIVADPIVTNIWGTGSFPIKVIMDGVDVSSSIKDITVVDVSDSIVYDQNTNTWECIRANTVTVFPQIDFNFTVTHKGTDVKLSKRVNFQIRKEDAPLLKVVPTPASFDVDKGVITPMSFSTVYCGKPVAKQVKYIPERSVLPSGVSIAMDSPTGDDKLAGNITAANQTDGELSLAFHYREHLGGDWIEGLDLATIKIKIATYPEQLFVTAANSQLVPISDDKLFVSFNSGGPGQLQDITPVSITSEVTTAGTDIFTSVKDTLTPAVLNGVNGYTIPYVSGWKSGGVKLTITVKYRNKQYPAMSLNLTNAGAPIEGWCVLAQIPNDGNVYNNAFVSFKQKRVVGGVPMAIPCSLSNEYDIKGVLTTFTRTPGAGVHSNDGLFTYNGFKSDGTSNPLEFKVPIFEKNGDKWTGVLKIPKA